MRTYMHLLKRGSNFTFHLASRTKYIRTKLMYFLRKLLQQFMRSETHNVLKISLHILLFKKVCLNTQCSIPSEESRFLSPPQPYVSSDVFIIRPFRLSTILGRILDNVWH